MVWQLLVFHGSLGKSLECQTADSSPKAPHCLEADSSTMTRKRIVRIALQTVVLVIVAWGIVHSAQKARVQLAEQRSELAEKARLTLEAASRTQDPYEKDRLQSEAERLQSAVTHFWQADPIRLVAAGLLYAFGMIPASWFWRQCLAAMDQQAPILVTNWAYFYGGLGKYFPGKAMVILIRLGALQEFGIKKMATTITIFMETLTMMAVGGAWAAVSLILLNLDWKLTTLAICLLAGTFLPTFPPILRLVITKLQPGLPAETLRSWTGRIHFGLILKGWVALSISWLAFGLSLLCILKGIPIAETAHVSWTTLMLSSLGACALAVVLGFVSLLPGGAGVREVVLSTILAPVVGPAAALCAAVWLRVTWLATELIAVALLAALRFTLRPRLNNIMQNI
jgi:glycosyltransferase 2 family protein